MAHYVSANMARRLASEAKKLKAAQNAANGIDPAAETSATGTGTGATAKQAVPLPYRLLGNRAISFIEYTQWCNMLKKEQRQAQDDKSVHSGKSGKMTCLSISISYQPTFIMT